MLSWVRIDVGIADDPKIAAIADLTAVPEAAVIGHLVMLLARMMNHAQDGNLSCVPDRLLERWAGWIGTPGKFADAVRRTMCRDDGVVAAWEKYNGAAIRRANADAERKRLIRDGAAVARRGAPQSSPHGSAGRPADSPPDVQRNETRRDATNGREKHPPGGAGGSATAPKAEPPAAATSDATQKPSWPAEAAEIYREHIGFIDPGRFGKALKSAVKQFGWSDALILGKPAVRDVLTCYCRWRPYVLPNGKLPGTRDEARKDTRFCSPEEFAKTYAQWAEMLEPVEAAVTGSDPP